MHRIFAVSALGAVLGAVALTPAVAGDAKPKDPNRIICEKQEVLGSRLATKRVCKSAAEWEAERAANRQTIDKSQVQRGIAGGG